ncbi:hypothetical protein [Mycobacterium sp. URHB0021]
MSLKSGHDHLLGLLVRDGVRRTRTRFFGQPSRRHSYKPPLIRQAPSSQALAQRCRIVPGGAAGKPNKEVAADVRI